MTDENLRELERRWRANPQELAPFAVALQRAGIPFAGALTRTRGTLLSSLDDTLTKYVKERDKLARRFMRSAERAVDDHAIRNIAITYVHLEDHAAVERIARSELIEPHHVGHVVREYIQRNDLERAEALARTQPSDPCIAVALAPFIHYQITQGNETVGRELAARYRYQHAHRDLAERASRAGHYEDARKILVDADVEDRIVVELLVTAAARRREYDTAQNFARNLPPALESAAAEAVKNGDISDAETLADQAGHRSGGAYHVILRDAARKRDYDRAAEYVLKTVHGNHDMWTQATLNGDFEVARYHFRSKKLTTYDRNILAIGHLRSGNLAEAQKLARTCSDKPRTYCNLALVLHNKDILNEYQ